MLQIPLFRNLKGRRLLRDPQFGPQNPAMGVLKSPGTLFRACVRRAFWRYTTTCEHSQELTPGLLELKVTGVFTASVPLRLFSCLTATSVVVDSLATVPPGDRFLSPILDGQGSYERGSRSTLVYRLELFFSLNILSV